MPKRLSSELPSHEFIPFTHLQEQTQQDELSQRRSPTGARPILATVFSRSADENHMTACRSIPWCPIMRCSINIPSCNKFSVIIVTFLPSQSSKKGTLFKTHRFQSSCLIWSMLAHWSKLKHVTWCWSLFNHFLWHSRQVRSNYSVGRWLIDGWVNNNRRAVRNIQSLCTEAW